MLIYNGKEIELSPDGNYINATQMCVANNYKPKAFISDWLTNAFVRHDLLDFSKATRIPLNDLVSVEKKYTWLHVKFATRFADCINEHFANFILLNVRVEEDSYYSHLTMGSGKRLRIF